MDELAAAALQFARAIVTARALDEGDRNLSVQEAADRLGVSRSTVYNRMRSGDLASVRIGSRRLIPASEIRRLTHG